MFPLLAPWTDDDVTVGFSIVFQAHLQCLNTGDTFLAAGG